MDKVFVKKIIKYCLMSLVAIVIIPGVAFLVLYATSPGPEQYTPSGESADGHGTVQIMDDPGIAGSGENILKLEFRTGPGGISEKGGLKINLGHVIRVNGLRRIYVPFELCPPGRCSLNSNFFKDAKIYTGNHSVVLKSIVPSGFELFRKYLGILKYIRSHETADTSSLLNSLHIENSLKIHVLRGELREGDLVTVLTGKRKDCSGISSPLKRMDIDVIVRTDGNGNGKYGLIPESARLCALSSKAARFNVATMFNPDPGVPVDLLVAALNDYPVPNRAGDYNGTVRFSSNNRVAGLPAQYTFRAKDRGVKRFRVIFPERGLYRISVRDGDGISGDSHYIDTRKHDKKIFFGDIHIHSIFSMYGERPPEDIYENRRDVYGLDFCSITDTCLKDETDLMKNNTTETDMHTDESGYTWSLASRYNKPGRFVTLKGYEFIRPQGGRRILFSDQLMKKSALHYMNETSEKAVIISDLSGFDAVSRAPGVRLQDRESRLVEICNSRGSMEYSGRDQGSDNIPLKRKIFNSFFSAMSGGGERPSGGDDPCPLQRAFAPGYSFGFTGSGYSDSHACGNTARVPGMTAVFSYDLNRKCIYRGLQSRDTYATTGARIGLRFSCNGSPMGSAITAEESPEIIAEILGAGPIRTVELVRHDGSESRNIFELRVDTFSGASPSVSKNTPSRYYANEDRNIVRLFYRDDSFKSDSSYYLRVTQADGNMAWSSPVWVSRKSTSDL